MEKETNTKLFGIGEYIKTNFVRMIELIAIVTFVFATMQSNINTQGEVLKNVVEQQRVQSDIMRDLAIAIAELHIRVSHDEDDHDNMLERLNNHLDRGVD